VSRIAAAARRAGQGWGLPLALCLMAMLSVRLAIGAGEMDLHAAGVAQAPAPAPGLVKSAVSPPAPPRVRARMVARYPHDPEAFTQGLVMADGVLYEGTGGYGRSSLRRVDLATGRVEQQLDLPSDLFGEGIAVWGEEIIQLTWTNRLGLRHRRDSFTTTGDFPLDGEGWGLTHDGRSWIKSDGSAWLRFLDPTHGREVRRVLVRDRGRPVAHLNELEYIDGEVWANIWFRDELVRIDPASGRVLGYIELAHLRPAVARGNREVVLNGIAWDQDNDRIFVTGKLWPQLFEIAVDGRVH